MKITRFFLLPFLLFCSCGPLSAQAQLPEQGFGDLHLHSLFKPRTSGMDTPWPHWEHTCPETAYDLVLNQAGAVTKFTQSDFESLYLGNVRWACVSLTPLEYGMRHPNIFKDLKKLRNSYACMGGVTPGWDFFLSEKVDYFSELMQGLDILAAGQGKTHLIQGDKVRYDIMTHPAQMEAVARDPQRIGVFLSIEGAHAFGTGPWEASKMVDHEAEMMENIDVLKGVRPMKKDSSLFPYPICFVTLNHFIWNGLSGHAKTFFGAQAKIFDQSEGLDQGMTPLGARVISRLLDRQAGRRILVDVKHMSLASRKWYYAYLSGRMTKGDTIPVVASHVGISGYSWDGATTEKERRKSDQENYLCQRAISLYREDIQQIFRTRGILGIMLDKYRIAGAKGKACVDRTQAGSIERRRTYVHLLVANMMAVVDALQCPEAWDIISIGSDFDGMINAMEPYNRATQFRQLHRDLLAYFSEPEDVFDLYSRRVVRQYMYGMTAEQLVNKVMGGNLQAFFKRTLATG